MKTLRKVTLALAMLLALTLASGCMSLEHLIDPDQKLEMYGGTGRSWSYIADEGSPFWGSLMRVIDLPFTVLLDTLLLPVSAPVELTRE